MRSICSSRSRAKISQLRAGVCDPRPGLGAPRKPRPSRDSSRGCARRSSKRLRSIRCCRRRRRCHRAGAGTRSPVAGGRSGLPGALDRPESRSGAWRFPDVTVLHPQGKLVETLEQIRRAIMWILYRLPPFAAGIHPPAHRRLRPGADDRASDPCGHPDSAIVLQLSARALLLTHKVQRSARHPREARAA